MRITCRVHPGAAHERVEWDGSVAGVWVTARAAEGRANRAALRALAGWLGVAPSRLRLVGGARARTKIVDVEGMEAPPPPAAARADRG